MSAIAAPPPWMLALPLDPGPWRVLVGLWTYADFGAAGPQLVGPSRGVLARRIGLSPRALRSQLAKLRADGWIRDAHGSRFGDLGIELAWMAAGEFGDDDSDDRALSAEAWIAENLEYGTPRTPAEVSRPAAEVSRSPADLGSGRGQPVGGRGQPHPPAEVSRSAAEVSTQTLQDLAVDPAETQQRSAREHVDADAAIDLELDARRAEAIARHREHADRQARLDAERAVERERSRTAGACSLPVEHRRAVEAVGGHWLHELARGRSDGRATWSDELARTVAALDLTPQDVTSVLEAWGRQVDDLGGPRKALARQGNRPGGTVAMPAASAVWWDSWRPWIREALGEEAEPVRDVSGKHSTAPLSCGASVPIVIPTLAEKLAIKRAAQAAREAARS